MTFDPLKELAQDEENETTISYIDPSRVQDLIGDDELLETIRPQSSSIKPGDIVPLGVRIDKGQGPLGASGQEAFASEIDTSLRNLRSWRRRHEQELAEALRRGDALQEDADDDLLRAALEAEDAAERPRGMSGGSPSSMGFYEAAYDAEDTGVDITGPRPVSQLRDSELQYLKGLVGASTAAAADAAGGPRGGTTGGADVLQSCTQPLCASEKDALLAQLEKELAELDSLNESTLGLQEWSSSLSSVLDRFSSLDVKQ